MKFPQLPRSDWSTTPKARPWLFGGVVAFLGISLTLFHLRFQLPSAFQGKGQDVIQIVVTTIIVGMLLVSRKAQRQDLGLTVGTLRTTALWTAFPLLVLTILALVFMAGAIILARTSEVEVSVRPGSLDQAANFWPMFWGGVVFAPLYEEVVWRGMLVSALDIPKRRWITLLISAALFALMHLAYGLPLRGLVGFFIMGLLLAWPYLRSRSLIAPVLIHALFNLGILLKDLVVLEHPDFVRSLLGYN